MPLPSITEQELLDKLKQHSIEITPLLQSALAQARDSHITQKRLGITPYLEEHIYPVASLIIDMCIEDNFPLTQELLASAILHDVLEDDPNITEESFKQTFGETVLEIVKWITKTDEQNKKGLSEDEKFEINKSVFKKLESAPKEAILIKLADKYNNTFCIFTALTREHKKYQRYQRELNEFVLPFAKKHSNFSHRILTSLIQ